MKIEKAQPLHTANAERSGWGKFPSLVSTAYQSKCPVRLMDTAIRIDGVAVERQGWGTIIPYRALERTLRLKQ